MKSETAEKPPSIWDKATAHAEELLKLPEAELMEKVRVKGNWKEDRLPTQEELTMLILKWANYCQ